MILQEIEYEGFRNLQDTRLEFSERFNLIVGANGSGKTNLLEAIFFSAYAGSFRTNDDRNLVKFNELSLRVQAKSNKTTASIFYNGEKRLILGGNQKRRIGDFIGWLLVTVFYPDDIWMIRGAPARRRNYIDWLISKLNSPYLSSLNEYRNILRQRNQLLGMGKETLNYELLDAFNEQLVSYGNEIYRERKKIIPILQQKISEIGEVLGLKNLLVNYQDSTLGMALDKKLLKEKEKDDFRYGQTTVGPHRDDILINLDGHPVKNFGSEGEARLSAVALKIAEARILREVVNEEPILLLDEVLSEVDEKRKKSLLEFLKGQIFYATIKPEDCPKELVDKIFLLEGGRVEVS